MSYHLIFLLLDTFRNCYWLVLRHAFIPFPDESHRVYPCIYLLSFFYQGFSHAASQAISKGCVLYKEYAIILNWKRN